MLNRRVGLAMIVMSCLAASEGVAQGFSPVINSPIITGPPVTYAGCIATDTSACSWSRSPTRDQRRPTSGRSSHRPS